MCSPLLFNIIMGELASEIKQEKETNGLRMYENRASLVVQSLRIHLPTQGTWVRALVQEDFTCHGATKPMLHNYWACTLEPTNHNCRAQVPHLLKPRATHLEPMLRNKRSHCNEKPAHHNKEKPPLTAIRESPHAAMKTQHSQK